MVTTFLSIIPCNNYYYYYNSEPLLLQNILRLTHIRSLPVVAKIVPTIVYWSIKSCFNSIILLFYYHYTTKWSTGISMVYWCSVHLFEFKFIMLFITCLLLFLILIPFNFVLLFTRYLAWFKIVCCFKPLLDAFQGSYKYKYYYWIAVNILVRNLFYVILVFTLELSLVVSALILITFTALNGYIQPNKNHLINT